VNLRVVKLIIAGFLVLVFSAVAVVLIDDSSIEYADLSRAERLGSTVQVVGTWERDKGMQYDASSNVFSFSMRDENGTLMPVQLTGPKPNNFEIAMSIVVKGRVENNVLKATNVLTKCPSKYEGNAGDLKEAKP